mgnify:CR=1 FL=1
MAGKGGGGGVSRFDRAVCLYPQRTLFNSIIWIAALAWSFIGVAIAADQFMAAIEVITSQSVTKDVVLPDGHHKFVEVRPPCFQLLFVAVRSTMCWQRTGCDAVISHIQRWPVSPLPSHTQPCPQSDFAPDLHSNPLL